MIPVGALGPAMSGLSSMMGSGGLGAAMGGGAGAAGGGMGGLMSMMGGGGKPQQEQKPMDQVDLTKKRQNALRMMEF